MLEIKLHTKKDIEDQVFVIEGNALPANVFNKEEEKFLKQKLAKDYDVAKIENLNKTVFVIKSPKEIDNAGFEKMRQKGAEIISAFNKNKKKDALLVGNGPSVLSVAEGMGLANYQFLKYFKDAKEKKNTMTSVHIVSPDLTKEDIKELNVLIEATLLARDLVNEPVSFLNAVELSKQITKMAKDGGFKAEVLDQRKIETLKMGGLLAVNKGSLDPATFTILEHKPAKAKNKKPIVLVGKGVVYDTGGLSLKPTPHSMDIMKCDMGGAAAVACAIYALAKANVPMHVIGLVPATDNRPGGNAYAPGDVITMFDGTTVEVLNTDAEGRMILADALSYAKKYKPELVMDAATLTGAAMRAIGDYATVIMGNANDEVFSKIEASAFKKHERVARFPFWDDYKEELKSTIADMTNLGGANGGAITAGKFLEHFTDYPWVHFDIAAPAWKDSPSGYYSAGGTGVGVRLFYDFIKNYKN